MSVPFVAPGPPSARDAGRLPPERLDGGMAPYRRPSTPARRRRRTVFALLGRFALAITIVLTPVAAAWWVLELPRLALSEVLVSGLDRVDRTQVDQAIAPFRGRNVLTIELAAVQQAVAALPWVAGVEVAKELPNRLRLKLVERVPVALLQHQGALSYLDVGGQVIAPFDQRVGTTGLLVIVDPLGNPASRQAALALAGEVSRADSVWGDGLETIEVLGEGDFRIRTRALPFPALVRSGRVAARARQLAALLPELERRYHTLHSIDLRLPDRIIVRPVLDPTPAATVDPTPASADPSAASPRLTAVTPVSTFGPTLTFSVALSAKRA